MHIRGALSLRSDHTGQQKIGVNAETKGAVGVRRGIALRGSGGQKLEKRHCLSRQLAPSGLPLNEIDRVRSRIDPYLVSIGFR